MKPIFLFFFCLCLATLLNAQISKTVNTTAGNLASTLTPDELSTVTNLTLTGTIDARDFIILCDSMPSLSVLDLSETSVADYSGVDRWGDSVYYPLNTIPESAFEDNETLISVVFPNTVTAIGAWAFDWATTLQSVTLPDGLVEIGEEAFDYTTGMTEFKIPASVVTIESGAFRRSRGKVIVDANNPYFSSNEGVLFDKKQTTIIFCPVSITGEYTVPSTVTTIADDAFDLCKEITAINFPPTLTAIGGEAFYKCEGLLSVDIPSTLKKIEYSCFKFCTGLTSVYIPESIDTIENNAFSNCTGLISVSIPSSVQSIGNWAFQECVNLQSIYSFIKTPILVSSSSTLNPFYDINKTNCILYVPEGTKAAYQAKQAWKDFSNIVEMYLTPSASLITYESNDSNTFLVDITTNVLNWMATSNQPWLTISPTSGTGNTSITITVQANTSNIPREAIVTLSANGVNDQTINFEQTATTDVSLLTEDNCTIYPNPFSDSFQIKGVNDNATVTLYNSNGQLLFSKNIIENEPIPSQNLSQGIYFLTIKASGKQVNKKIVKR